MKKLSQKAKEVLDICLAAESPEVKARVYEILEVSELDSSDPMFLVLALTGQMRVLLEAAPADLAKLLDDWRSTSARSLVEIQQAITQVKATQQQQANTLKKTLESVANGYVKGIKEAGMATTSAIAAANSETLSQARLATQSVEELKDEVVTLCTSVEADRRTNEDVLKVLLGRIGQTTGGLETAIAQMNGASTAITRLQQNTTWIKFADWFSPLAALVIALLIGAGGGWWAMSLKYNDSVNVLERNLVDWNGERILKCRRDNNPKCTVWIVPPEQRK
ncbi:DUF6753 family protein [Gloeocapsa sp. BRSZ]